MTSLDSMIATAGEAPLANSLDFSLPPASTAIVDRRQHKRAFPTSASTISYTQGTKTVRLRLGGDCFVDPHSIRLMFTIRNGDATNALSFQQGPWGAWGQVYLRSSGVEIDNILAYGRHHQQFMWNNLSQAEQFGEAGITGLHGSWAGGTPLNVPRLGTIAAGQSYTVMHKLALSILAAGKMLPVRYCPLELELSLTNVATDWLTGGVGNSTTFSLENVQLLYDEIVPDEAVLDSFYKALMASRVLTIPCLTAYVLSTTLTPGQSSFSYAAVRAFSRVSHVYLSFQNIAQAKNSSFINPTTITNNTGAAPSLSDANGGAPNCPYARLSIGSKYYPDPQPMQTIPELFYAYQKSLPNIPNMSRDQYQFSTFSVAFDLRRIPEDPTSSISTRSGDLLRVELQNLTNADATIMWMTIFAFSTVAIREQGVVLLT